MMMRLSIAQICVCALLIVIQVVDVAHSAPDLQRNTNEVNDADTTLEIMNRHRRHDLRTVLHLRHKLDRVHAQQVNDRARIEVLEQLVKELIDRDAAGQRFEDLDDASSSNADYTMNLATTLPEVDPAMRSDSHMQHQDPYQHQSTTDHDEQHQDPYQHQSTTDHDEHLVSIHDSSLSLVSNSTPKVKDGLSLNQKKATVWMEEEVSRVQQLVDEMEKTCNVTSALHDRQEVLTRLEGLEGSLTAIQKRLSTVTASSESTKSMMSTVLEETRDCAEKSQKTGAKTANLETEVSSVRADFNELLSSLPDGLLSNHSRFKVASASEKRIISESETVAEPEISPSHKSDRQYEEWIKSLRSGLAKVQESSVQLLEAVDDLEIRQETDRTQLLREVAKLEFNMSQTVEEQREEVKRFEESIDTEHGLVANVRNLAEEVGILQKYVEISKGKFTETDSRIDGLANLVAEHLSRTQSYRDENIQNHGHKSGRPRMRHHRTNDSR